VDVRPVKAGPVQVFAADLRALRRRCGTPDFTAMARRTGASVDALNDAVGGEHLPAWATVAAFVRGCGAQAADWRGRWEEARDGMLVRIPVPRRPS
jgi:hypothetical protein